MAQGAFTIDYDEDSHTGRKKGITFCLKDSLEPTPEDQTALWLDIERVVETLRQLFPERGPRFDSYLEDAFSLASVGLVGPMAKPATAVLALQSLKETILGNEAGRVKNRHLRDLGRWALGLGAAAVLLGLALHALAGWGPLATANCALLAQFCYAWAGAMAGTWVSFGWRKAQFRFEDLGRPEADFLCPPARLVFTGLQTVIIGLLFTLGVVNVGFGQIDTAGFAQSVEMALLVGLLCGFSEQTLPSAIARQATTLLRGAAPAKGAA